MRYIFLLFFVVFTFSGCEKKIGSSNDYKAEAISITASEPAQPLEENIVIPQKIIKEAYLKFETSDLEETYNQIQTAIKANKGSIQNDSQEKSYDNISRTINVRVPSQNFDAFIESISKGVAYFDQKNISSQNVTEEFIDLTSRLKTKRKLEERYIQILQKATKVSEILEIEQQISTIREEIEAKEGKLKYLESRVAESTISIEFYKTIAQKEGVKASYGSKIWTAIQSGFFSLSEFLISIISVWPFIVLFCLLAYFIRKRFKRKKI
jgi:hypothetical protein